jgi:tRNA wybutosine-synthesizing protein 3
MEDIFLQRKSDVLSKLDKSSKGGWDKHILELCEEINKSENYYTTSSCSGRIVLILDCDEKKQGLFVKVYHDEVEFEGLKSVLASLCSELMATHQTSSRCSAGNLLKGKSSINCSSKSRATLERGKNGIRFKMESCILHVACKTLEDAQKLFDKAKLAGWKRSGIIASGNRFMLELNSTEKLEFPIIRDGKVLVGDDFLKIVVKEANEKLEKGWKKIEKLMESLE